MYYLLGSLVFIGVFVLVVNHNKKKKQRVKEIKDLMLRGQSQSYHIDAYVKSGSSCGNPSSIYVKDVYLSGSVNVCTHYVSGSSYNHIDLNDCSLKMLNRILEALKK